MLLNLKRKILPSDSYLSQQFEKHMIMHEIHTFQPLLATLWLRSGQCRSGDRNNSQTWWFVNTEKYSRFSPGLSLKVAVSWYEELRTCSPLKVWSNVAPLGNLTSPQPPRKQSSQPLFSNPRGLHQGLFHYVVTSMCFLHSTVEVLAGNGYLSHCSNICRVFFLAFSSPN